MTIKWDITKKDSALLEQCVDRFYKLRADYAAKIYGSRTDMSMDLNAAHSNGCPLDFEKLLSFPDFDFEHDVLGIQRRLDRKTGKLGAHFLPRCAKTKAAKAA